LTKQQCEVSKSLIGCGQFTSAQHYLLPHIYFAVSYVLLGLHIVYTQDEVDVVQNLMFYIEAAYKVAVSLSVFFI